MCGFQNTSVSSYFRNRLSRGGAAVWPGDPLQIGWSLCRDGLLDLAVVAENSNFVRVLLNQGNGSFKAVAQYEAEQQPVTPIAGTTW
jgi:hypothetical protein